MLSQGYRSVLGSQKLILAELPAGGMWDGLAHLPFTTTQEPHGKQIQMDVGALIL